MIFKAGKKIRNQKGFTLAELLITILILLMATSIVAAGVPAAQNAYFKAVDAGNAQVLLSTAMSALRDELGTAYNITASDGGKTITYASGKKGYYYTLANSSDGKTITKTITGYKIPGSDELQNLSDKTSINLISDKAITDKMSIGYESVSYDLDTRVVTFENLEVKKNNDVIASAESFKIRSVNDFQA